MPEFESQFIPEEYMGEEEREDEGPEIMKVPEIVIQPERGMNLMSVALKGYNPEWGNRDHELARLAEQHFSEHPLNSEVESKIRELKGEGVDEESLYYLSLTYGHPERMNEVFDLLKKHKEVRDPERVQQRLVDALERLDSDPSLGELEEDFTKYIQEDIDARRAGIEEVQRKIGDLINFFRPKAETTRVRRVNIVPTDFLYHPKTGKGFMLGGELVLMSPREDSTGGQAHEFLHSVVNPIIDKLGEHLTDDQKRKIVESASGKSRQRYGQDMDNYHSLLSEGFIRTYLNSFEKGVRPHTYESFQELISQKIPDEKRFQEILAEDEALKQRCTTLGISSLEDLNTKSRDYFEVYEKDRLGETVYRIYEDYKNEGSDKPELTFEDFILEKFPQYLETAEKGRTETD